MVCIASKKRGVEQGMEFHTNLFVIFAYIALALIFTYPIIFRISDWIIGFPGDTESYINVMWWFEKSFLNPNLSFYDTSYLYYPTGATLASSEIGIFLLISSLPIQVLFGRIVAYDIIVLSSFILSGFGTYLLVNYLTADKRASFIAGFIFAFFPQHFMHALMEITIASVGWIPFFILYFLKMMKEGKRKDAILAALFFAFASLCSWFNLMYLLLFIGLYTIFGYFNNKEEIVNRKSVMNLLLLGTLSFLLILPFAYPMLAEITKGSYAYPPSFHSIFYSADLVGFLVPSIIHPLFGRYVKPIYENFSGNIIENTTYIGYAVISLVAYYILKNKKKLGESGFWIFSSLSFFILSLGPFLHVMGHLVVFPFPYIIAYLLILPLRATRTPSRMAIMMMLSLAVLAGYGVKAILVSTKGRAFNRIDKKDIVALLILFLIFFEFAVFPCPVFKVDVPAFYRGIAVDKEDYAIMEVPLDPVWIVSEYMYYQTIHEKRLVGGYLSRTPDYASAFLGDTPVISDFWNLHASSDILNQDYLKGGAWLLNYYNIRYVILHKDNLNGSEFEYANNLAKNIFDNASPIYEDNRLVVYRVNSTYTPPLYMICGDGFYPAETWSDNFRWRWAKEDARLEVISNNEKNVSVDLKFFAASPTKQRTLEVIANNISVYNITVMEEGREFIISGIMLRKGNNTIEFNTSESLETIDSALHNGDMRMVSIGLRNVSLELRGG